MSSKRVVDGPEPRLPVRAPTAHSATTTNTVTGARRTGSNALPTPWSQRTGPRSPGGASGVDGSGSGAPAPAASGVVISRAHQAASPGTPRVAPNGWKRAYCPVRA